jgi:pimeloyl-ACP methyl ester carboxylesterase
MGISPLHKLTPNLIWAGGGLSSNKTNLVLVRHDLDSTQNTLALFPLPVKPKEDQLNDMSTKQPIVVVVPGAWSSPAAYRKLVNAFEAKQFTVHVPALPTNNGARPPNSSYEADVAVVRELVESLVTSGNEVALVMHSYGGAVGTEALKGLARKDRQAQSLPGGVVHLMYLAAYFLAKGQSVWKIVEKSGIMETMVPHVTIEEDGTWLPNDAVWAVYQDICLANAKEAGVSVNVVKFDCAHSVYAKYPNEITDLLVKAVG